MLQTMIAGSQKILEQLDGMSAYLPPEYKDMLGQVTSHQPALNKVPEVRLQQRGTLQVDGYSCKRYQVFEGQTLKGEACMASPSQLAIPASDVAGLAKATQATKGLLEKLPGVSKQQLQSLSLFEYGIPLFINSSDGQNWKLQTASTSTQVLSVPAGYTRKAFSMPQF